MTNYLIFHKSSMLPRYQSERPGLHATPAVTRKYEAGKNINVLPNSAPKTGAIHFQFLQCYSTIPRSRSARTIAKRFAPWTSSSLLSSMFLDPRHSGPIFTYFFVFLYAQTCIFPLCDGPPAQVSMLCPRHRRPP